MTTVCSDMKCLRSSIAAGVDFVAQHQYPSGHFVAYRSDFADGTVGKEFDISTFVTVSAVYCLQWVSSDQANQVRGRAIEGLVGETPLRGFYRYFAEEQNYKPLELPGTLPLTIVPDLDTTSCMATVMSRCGHSVDAADVLIAQRNDCGLFPTWVTEAADDLDDSLPFLIMLPSNNEPCCGVNANVLTYLGDRNETREASEFIRAAYEDKCRTQYAQWYQEPFQAYMCSRAFFEGACSLAPIRDELLGRLCERQLPDGSCGTAIETAAAACALLNFNAVGSELESAIRFLTTVQRADGGWPRGTFYIGDRRNYGVEIRLSGTRRLLRQPTSGDGQILCYCGSDEITTLFCLEALSRFAEAG